jgi:hypothetical protein
MDGARRCEKFIKMIGAGLARGGTTGRPRNRAAIGPSGRSMRPRSPMRWPDGTEALGALARAWSVTTVALALLLGAVVLAPMWDRAVFLQALRQSLSSDPETALPLEAPVDALASP